MKKAIKKRHGEATPRTVLDLVEGRDITNVQDLLRHSLPKEKIKHIKTITTDMCWPDISSAQKLLPKVTLIHNRFH